MARWDQGDTNRIPDWFFQAVETPSQSHRVEVDECDVHYRTWFQNEARGQLPGLLLIHGMNAHSHWWDFIAPQLSEDYLVAAMDLTGMGDSDYRYDYSGKTYADEIAAVCDALAFDTNVTLVGHSFGGFMSVKAVNRHPQRFGRLILADSGIRHPDEQDMPRPPMGGRAKLYPDQATGLARFRLQPPQSCDNDYILEYIARHSLMPMDGGWTWKFDEDLLDTLKDAERTPEEYQNLTIKLGVLYGAESELFSSRTLDYMRELIPADFPAQALEGAQHHLFLDQPLEFVTALKQMLATL